jgi:asparagine synthase (glutamine-hydrolysing)
MCGLVGVVSSRDQIVPPLVERMRDTLRHRGPDDAGLWSDETRRVVLGHRRLSIFDLSPLGHQPMHSPCGRYTVVFNGEIYNFRALRGELAAFGITFRTQSDTEVLLASYATWGADFLGRLVGMFAFALYDHAAQRLLLARDRAGEKPLFFAHQRGRLLFGSELKALMADPELPRRVDLTALDHYLAFGYVPGAACLLAGVAKLPPAHALSYDLATDTVRTWPYWQLPAPCTTEASLEPLADELETLLAQAVQQQLSADVPVGVLLSGGIDSSLVTALAARAASQPLRTFTIAFPGHGAFNEGPYARLVADHFGTRHTELEAEAATIDLLPTLVRQYDEPIADSSMIPTFLVSQLIRKECTVALGGDGGDELFGGYTLYRLVQAQQAMRAWLPSPARRTMAAIARRLPVGTRGRNYVIGLDATPTEAVARTGLHLDVASRDRLVPALRSLGAGRAERYRQGLACAGSSVLQQLTAADFGSYLPDDILVKVDRASMLASLEVRAPFLDHRIIEFAFGRVPDRFRGTVQEGKVILRHLARRLLPTALDLDRKRGFSIPLSGWFKGPLGERMAEVLESAPNGWLNRYVVSERVTSQGRRLANTQRLFALTMLEMWRREYRIDVP